MSDEIKTHRLINRHLCGEPVETRAGASLVEMVAGSEMAVDAQGLTHGGFVFGLADHAAMIAVNHPNVVLGSADVKFLKPVKTGDRLMARAAVAEEKGKKRRVRVQVTREADIVFEGDLTCFVLEKHVLA